MSGLHYNFATEADTSVRIERPALVNKTGFIPVNKKRKSIEALHKKHPEYTAGQLATRTGSSYDLVYDMARELGWNLAKSKAKVSAHIVIGKEYE
jgi:hypothetical protein